MLGKAVSMLSLACTSAADDLGPNHPNTQALQHQLKRKQQELETADARMRHRQETRKVRPSSAHQTAGQPGQPTMQNDRAPGLTPQMPEIPERFTSMRPKSARELRHLAPARPQSAVVGRSRPQSAHPTKSAVRPFSARPVKPASSRPLSSRQSRLGHANNIVATPEETQIKQQFDLELSKIKSQIQKEKAVTTEFVAAINDSAQHFYHSK